MRGRRRSLARALLAGLLALLCPLVGSAAVAGNMARQSSEAAAALRHGTQTLATAVRLQQAVARTETQVSAPGLYLGQPAARAAFDDGTRTVLALYDELAGQAGPHAQPAVRRGLDAYGRFRAAGLALADLPGNPGDPAQAGNLARLLVEIGSRLQDESVALGEVYDAVRTQVAATSVRVARAQRSETLLLVLLAGAGTAVGIGMAVLVYRRLTRPLHRLRDASERAADDRLPEPIPVPAERELAEVANAFNAMVARLADSRAELADREARFRALVQHSSDLILLVDDDGRVREVAGTDATTFWPADHLTGQRLQHWLDPASAAALDAVLAARQPGERRPGESAVESVEVRLETAAGDPRTVELLIADLRGEPAVGGLVLTGRDVTDRTQLAAQLAHQALHDELTGLANRQLFTDRLARALSRRDGDGQVAVLYVDLDRFKQVNDSAGHAAGDRLLRAVASRLSVLLRPADTAARLGGDEFAVLLDGVTGAEEAAGVADRLLAALAEPVDIGQTSVVPGASIGVATAVPGPDADPELLLAHADAAMYLAKQHRHCVVTYSPRLLADRTRTNTLRRELTGAADRGELSVHYQPIIGLADGRTVGVEALARWTSPTLGSVPPDEFIPVAEQAGLIGALGAWVLLEACTTVAGWPETGGPAPALSVNVSARQLADPDFPALVAGVLTDTGLAPGRLTLEITERALLAVDPQLTACLAALKSLGVRLALDDFGTGYSSYGTLRHLPLDTLKVDRSFVTGLDSSRGTAVTDAVLALARALDLDAVAEGIETGEQATRLRALSCDYAQGYYFGRPDPAETGEALPTPRSAPADETTGSANSHRSGR